MEILKELLLKPATAGIVEWIGVSPGTRAAIEVVGSVDVITGGLRGDHHCRPAATSKRQVTLIQAEHLPVVAGLLSLDVVDPKLLRRNIVVSGFNLAALRFTRFQIGTAVLEGTGICPPCSRMEENLGRGGYAAMVNHGGITAIVLDPGVITLGDSVRPLELNIGTQDER